MSTSPRPSRLSGLSASAPRCLVVIVTQSPRASMTTLHTALCLQNYGVSLGSRLKSLEYESLDGRDRGTWGDPSHSYIGPYGGGLRDTAISSYLGEDALERRLANATR